MYTTKTCRYICMYWYFIVDYFLFRFARINDPEEQEYEGQGQMLADV